MDRDALIDRLAARLHRRRGAPVPPVPRPRSLAVPSAVERDALVRRFAERLRDLGGEAAVVADRNEAQAALERLLVEREDYRTDSAARIAAGRYNDMAFRALKDGAPIADIAALKCKDELTKTKFEEHFDDELAKVYRLMDDEFKRLGEGVSR